MTLTTSMAVAGVRAQRGDGRPVAAFHIPTHTSGSDAWCSSSHARNSAGPSKNWGSESNIAARTSSRGSGTPTTPMFGSMVIEIPAGRDGSVQRAAANFDGCGMELETGDAVRIVKSERTTDFIKLGNAGFLEILHKKMSDN